MDQLTWINNLRSFLNELLYNIISNDTVRATFLNTDSMKIWVKAFTHETYDYNNNYEDLEYYGDRMLKAVFAKYLTIYYPQLHKNDYTVLDNTYMAKVKQREFSKQLGLVNYIRLDIDNKIRSEYNVESDVFESFFGALATIADNIVPGTSFAYTYNMLLYIFKDIVIDIKDLKGSTKTLVQQIFSRFGFNINEIHYKDGTNEIVTVELTPDILQFLADYDITIDNKIIGIGRANTETEASNLAYDQAEEILAQYGINTKWAELIKNYIEFSNEKIAQYVPMAKDRLNREGYITMYFIKPGKTYTKYSAIIQLIGEREDGTKQILASKRGTDASEHYVNTKSDLVRMYGKYQKY